VNRVSKEECVAPPGLGGLGFQFPALTLRSGIISAAPLALDWGTVRALCKVGFVVRVLL